MTKLIFITSGKINYVLTGHDLYKSIEKTALGEQFPHLVSDSTREIVQFASTLEKYKPTCIITAPSSQALETACIVSGALKLKVVTERRLLPLRFELKKLVSSSEFTGLKTEKFNVLRKRYLDAYFENSLIDSKYEIRERFDFLRLKYLSENPNSSVIAVSHAYLIKLFSLYSMIGEEMFANRRKLFDLFKPEKEPMSRLNTKIIEI